MTPPGGVVATEPHWLDAPSLPECLRELSRPPAGLWLLGAADGLEGAPQRHVAIVGTRDASSYGERTAANLATACARAGFVVVSGMARGIDAAAHRAALAAEGRTVAVQGTGVDVPYPVGHRALHRELSRRGTVLSEMDPGTRATPGCFPRRNRLIAGLCEVTVVVEAGFKSGAINTASQALELGRTVAAVPGPIDEPRSAGANQLIRDGAQVIASVDDLLMLLGLSTSGVRMAGLIGMAAAAGPPSSPFEPLEEHDVSAVLRCLQHGPARAEEIAEAANMPVRRVSALLLDLELQGRIAGVADRYRLAG